MELVSKDGREMRRLMESQQRLATSTAVLRVKELREAMEPLFQQLVSALEESGKQTGPARRAYHDLWKAVEGSTKE